MAYFIHNKYDSNSIAQVTNTSGTNYIYNDDSSVTVIDYFGLLENGTTTYKYLDTTYMGIQTISSLTYTTIDTSNLVGSSQTTDGDSNTEYASGISEIVESLQTNIGDTKDTGGSTSSGTVMAKLNTLLKTSTGEYEFTASDDLLATIKSSTSSYYSGTETIATVTPKYSGTLRFKITGYLYTSSYTGTVTIGNSSVTITSTSSATYTMDVACTAGNTLSITITPEGTTSARRTYISNISMYGTLEFNESPALYVIG